MYTQYVDNIVKQGFSTIIKASLNYLLRETDYTKASLDPLFEAQLQLKPPEILFSPSLTQNDSGGFYEQIEEIIANVYDQSTMISRIAKHTCLANYQVYNFSFSKFLYIYSIQYKVRYAIESRIEWTETKINRSC